MEKHIQFSEDLLNLYCRTKVSAIEDVFVKFSRVFNKENIDFISWFGRNKKILKSKVSSDSIIDTFEILIDLKNIISNDDPSLVPSSFLSDIVKKFHESGKNLNTIPMIKIFSNIVASGRFNEILLPFKTSIVFIDKYFQTSDLTKGDIQRDKNRIEKDLDIISALLREQDTEYSTEHVKKVSVKNQRKNMLVNLLMKFTYDISFSFKQSGMEDIGNEISSQNILASSESLGEVFDLSPLNYTEINTVKYILEDVWKRYGARFLDYNYDYIQVNFLNKIGVMSDEDYYAIQKEYLKTEGLIPLMEAQGELASELEMETFGKITLDKKTNPKYLQMLVLFFFYYRQKLNM